jgi:hypothetical protein
MKFKGKWHIGGRRISREDRERIVETYITQGRAAADAIAVGEFRLDEWYAYKVAHASGRLPLRVNFGAPVKPFSVAQRAYRAGLRPCTVYRRIRNGMALAEALKAPVRGSRAILTKAA